MLEGKRIKLRLLEPKDLEEIVAWRNSDQAYDAFFTHTLLNLDKQTRWYEDQLNDPSQFNFAIVHSETGLTIGMISLYHIDPICKRCEWGRVMIGNKNYLDSGYAREAIEVVLEYAFEYLGMHRVQCTAMATNKKVVQLYDSIGFRREGVWREYVFKKGRYVDVVFFSMLQDEYRERQGLLSQES